MFRYTVPGESYHYPLSLLLLSLLILAGCGGTPVAEAPTNTPALPTATPLPTATVTLAPTDMPTPTPTPTDTPTLTPTQMSTDTPTPTPTPTPLHPALLVDETFDEDTLGWNWEGQEGMDGIEDGKLWVYGPPDDPDRYAASFVMPQVSVSIPGDATVEMTFDRFPKFSGPWFRVSEGWFVIVLEEDGSAGLLRPALEEAGKAWDSLGQIPRAPDGTVTLRLIFQGDKLQVWGNGRQIATRTADIFAETKQFGGFYIGEEARFAVDRLNFWTTPEVAAQLAPGLTPVITLDEEAAAALGFKRVQPCTDETSSVVRVKFKDGFIYCISGNVLGWHDGTITIKEYEYSVQVARSGEANYIHILNTELVRVASDEEASALLGSPLPTIEQLAQQPGTVASQLPQSSRLIEVAMEMGYRPYVTCTQRPDRGVRIAFRDGFHFCVNLSVTGGDQETLTVDGRDYEVSIAYLSNASGAQGEIKHILNTNLCLETIPTYLDPFQPSIATSIVLKEPGPLSDAPPPFEGYFLEDWKRSGQRSGTNLYYPGEMHYGIRHPVHPMSEYSITGIYIVFGRIQGFGRLEQDSWDYGDEPASTGLWVKLDFGELAPSGVWARVPLGGMGVWYLVAVPDESAGMNPLGIPEPLGPNAIIEPEERRFDSRNLRLGDVIGILVPDRATYEKLQAGEIDRIYSGFLVIVGGTRESQVDILEGDKFHWP